MNKFTLFAAMTALAFRAGAVEVANTPGQLHTLLPQHDITELTISGEIDARDFKFIGDSLNSLQSLDISQASIVAYSNVNKPLIASISEFPEATLPQMMLFGHELSEIILPQNLKAIGHAALAGCANLQQITIPESVKDIGDYAFYGSALTSITLPDNLTVIGKAAFANCNALTSANIPAGIIGDKAFEGNTALVSITIGAKVTAIGNEAFLGTNITNLDLSQATTLTTIGDWAAANTKITTATLPNSLTKIGEGAFFGNSQLTQINLPQSVTRIPDLAYAEMRNITLDSLLHDNITHIGDYAFYNWARPTHFYIPASVTYIGSYAMAGMEFLTQIDSDAPIAPQLGENVWHGIDQSNVTLGTPDNTAAATYEAAEQWKNFYILHDYLLGDVNGDGFVNVADINLMISKVLGNNPEPFIFLAGDINDDKTITVPDLNLLSGYLLENNAPTARRAKANQSPTTDDLLSLRSFAIKAGQRQTVDLLLDNQNTYSALECTFNLPEGLNIVGAVNTGRSNTHTALTAGNRLIAYSMNLNNFEGDNGSVLKLTLEATQDIPSGTTIELTNVILADNNGNWARARNSITTIDQLTGVDNLTASVEQVYAFESTLVIEAEHDSQAQIVTVNGQAQTVNVTAGRNEINNLAAGIYIVRLNGQSHKVVIK